MLKLWSFIKQFFKVQTQQQLRDQYLAESLDLVDLERRQRELERRGIL